MSIDGLPYDSALISAEQEKFKEHLNKRSTEIKSATSAIFAQLPSPTPDARQLQERLTNLLAAQKVHETELHRLSAEKDQLSERLEDACYRYMIAEKKLDRTKSAQVAKLEAQGIAGSRTETSSGQGESSTVSDGVIQHNSNSGAGESGSVDDAKQKEAVAAAGRRAEQVERLAAENKKLTEELTASQVRLAGLTDEDYASSDLFRLLKTQHEEVIKRANNLEAINTLLRAEAKQLQAERSSYREEAERELSSASIELESQLARTEADLARIRHTRDELMTDVNMRKTTHDTSQASSMQVKELANAQELRISALESEVDRFRQQEDAADHVAQGDPAAEALSPSVLHNRLGSLEKEKIMLETELKSMEAAYRKASAAASKRVAETAETEEKITRLVAEKAKADQKYFGAMKAKEARESEFKALKTQSMKSSEIVMQLKEAESSCSSLLVNLEKQLADARDSLSGLTLQYRTAQSTVAEQKISNDRQAVNITELKKLLADKDTAAEAAAKAQRDAEVEASELKVRVQEFQKSLETWRKKGIGNQSEEYEMLRVSSWTSCANFVHFANSRSRPSLYAPFAGRTSKTLQSRHAAMCFVRSASTNACSRAPESVRIAAGLLASTTTFALPYERFV